MTLDIFKDCHPGYSNLKIYSPIKFCCGHMFQWYKKVRSFKSHLGYKISRSHSPEELFIALATGLLLKSNTAPLLTHWRYWALALSHRYRLIIWIIHPTLGSEQAIIWTNDGLGYWRINASFTFNEFRTRRTTTKSNTKYCAREPKGEMYICIEIQCGYVSAPRYVKVPQTLEPACLLIDPTS